MCQTQITNRMVIWRMKWNQWNRKKNRFYVYEMNDDILKVHYLVKRLTFCLIKSDENYRKIDFFYDLNEPLWRFFFLYLTFWCLPHLAGWCLCKVATNNFECVKIKSPSEWWFDEGNETNEIVKTNHFYDFNKPLWLFWRFFFIFEVLMPYTSGSFVGMKWNEWNRKKNHQLRKRTNTLWSRA